MVRPSPRILATELLSDGYLKLRRLQVRLAEGVVVARETISFGSAVAVLPYDASRRCALTVSLFRPAVFEASGSGRIEEACAGMREAGETADTSVRREAQEELGVTLTALERVAEIWSSPGVSTERIALYLAPYSPARRLAPGGGAPAEHEDIKVQERGLPWPAAGVDAGVVEDPKLLILIQALRRRRPDLFSAEETAPAAQS